MGKANLALVGFMGSGKSTVGRAAAAKLGLAFADSDAIVEGKAGKTIEALFAEEGEPVFRRLEKEVLLDLCREERLVIATGGGAFVDAAIRRALLETAVVVHLSAPFRVLWERASQSADRPLLSGPDGKARAMRLLEERLNLYRRADVTVDASRPVPEIVEEVVNEYRCRCEDRRSKR